MSVCELVFRQSGRDLLHFRVDRAETCLGPHPTNDVIVPNSTLPDVTAVLIDRGAEQYTIRSLAPDQVCVNAQVLSEDECPLRDEDVITIGEYVLVFRIRKETGFVEGQTKVLSAETKTNSQATRK